MVKITITPTALFFADMSDEVLRAIGDKVEVKNAPRGYVVTGTKENLFMVLVDLAQVFDLEIG